MQQIISVNNELVKETVKLQQKKYRETKFLLEGYKCVEEAFTAGIDIQYAFVLEEKAQNYSFLGDKIILTNEPVLKKISTTESAPDIVAVALKKEPDKKILKNSKKVLLLENIKDLGNLGTIIRTSAAFGADAIILYGKECADIYNPKCVRSSVGNLWKIPVFYIEELEGLKKHFENFNRVATLPKADNYLKNFQLNGPSLIMFGSEAEGLSQELIDYSNKQIKIEMSENVESLNLSVSCAVVLYKLFV